MIDVHQQTILAQAISLLCHGKTDAGQEKLSLLDLSDGKIRKGLLHDVVKPLMKAGDFKAVLPVLAELVKTDGNDAPTLAKYALALGRNNRLEQAIDAQQKAVRLAGENTGYKSTLLLLLKRAGRMKKACKIALDYQKLWQSDVRFAHISAMVLGRYGLREDALVAAKIVADGDTIDRDAALVVAEVFLASEMFDDVEAVFHKANLLSSTGDVIRLIVWPAVERGDLDYGLVQIRLLNARVPQNTEVLTLYGNVFLRMGKAEEAVSFLQQAVDLAPELTESTLLLMQALVVLEKFTKAHALAIHVREKRLENRHLTIECARIFISVNDGENGLNLASQIFVHLRADGEMMAMAVRLQLHFSKADLALQTCKAALFADLGKAVFKPLLAKSLLAMGEAEQAIDTFIDIAAGPECHVETLVLLSEQLVTKGRIRQAEKYLAQLIRKAPDNAGYLARYGTVLKLLRKNDQAAEILMWAIDLDGGSEGIVRAAMACLMQCDRKQDAMRLYEKFQCEKRALLPTTFTAGLEMTGQLARDVELPPERLEWAWKIAQRFESTKPLPDRVVWEQAAKKGYIADQLLSAWLEGRPERRSEICDLIVGLDETFKQIGQIAGLDQGLIVASAHVGPMYAGPLAFYEMGRACKWVAAIPTVSSLGYGDLLISTIEQPELMVVDAVYKALDKGQAVLIAVDGTDHPGAATVEFEGRTIRYSDFAARASFKRGVPSAFGVSLWKGQNIEFQIFAMPRVESGEGIETYVARWNNAFFDHLRKVLLLGPENLRLGGGLWR